MLRRMCKKCAENNEAIYVGRKLTGQIAKRKVIGGSTVTILKCTECGNKWSYWRKIRK